MLSLAPVIGCAGREDAWTEARAACGLEEGEYSPFPTDGSSAWEAVLVYDRTCAEAMAEDLGVVWTTFPDTELPGSLTGTPLEKYLAGVWVFVAADFGAFGDLRHDPRIPASFEDEAEEYSRALGFTDATPAGRFLYDYVASEVHSTVQGADGEATTMAWWSGRLTLAAMSEEQGEGHHPYEQTSSILHEASHAGRVRHHVDCETGRTDSGGLDETWDGPYGIGGFAFLLLQENLPDLALWSEAQIEIDRASRSVCDPSSIPF